MQKLVKGIHRFQHEIFGTKRELFETLVDGQRPLALFITCSDSRIDPALMTQTEPGELFILRNAGNIVPPHGAGNGGEAATIEFAVKVLGVKDIIICGHSYCGAMNGLLEADVLADLPAMKQWLSHAGPTVQIIRDNYEHISESSARLTAAIEENVLVQLENLRTHPSVAAALERKDLHVHAWVYRFESGEVFAYDPGQEQYVPLEVFESPDRSDVRPRTI